MQISRTDKKLTMKATMWVKLFLKNRWTKMTIYVPKWKFNFSDTNSRGHLGITNFLDGIIKSVKYDSTNNGYIILW